MSARRLVLAVGVALALVACSGGNDDTLPSIDSTTGVSTAAGGSTSPADTMSAGVGTGSDAVGTTTTVDPAAVTTTAAPTTTVAPTTPPPPPTDAPTTVAPTAPPTTQVPQVEATAFAVYDMRSGQFLASNQPDAQLPVGSVIKLLAAQTAYNAGQPTRIVTAPPGLIVDPEESRIGIYDGQELPRDLLIRAMLIVSANDAARMLAIDISGGEAQFAEAMNQTAAAMGLTNTHAVNATGLDADGQFSSASDLTRLSAALMGNQTFQLTVRRTEANLNGQSLPSTNDLLTKYPGADGVKTGHTTNAGWCIVASALRDGRRIIVTVLGAPTEAARDVSATALLDWAFTQP